MPAHTPSAAAAGIASIGLNFPPLAMSVEELARLRGQDPKKFTIGLGCREMALCTEDYGVVEMAVEAAKRALGRWDGGLERIGLIAVGTESALDMSRPLSAWVADRLGLAGAVRSYEVKHACYGGTLALRQALEWKMSGASAGHASAGRAALVIAADEALYELQDPGEPTQGAGAVAMIVDEPSVAAVDPVSFPWSEPVFDFWRPVGDDHPSVDGPLSLDCYKRAAEYCFGGFLDNGGAIADFAAVCYHVPFAKMVKKAVLHVGDKLGWDAEAGAEFFAETVDPYMDWNRRTGNAYTASLWISVAQALAGMDQGRQVAAFSYGSGFGAELLTLAAGPRAAAGAWAADAERDFARREMIDAEEYAALRGEKIPAMAAA